MKITKPALLSFFVGWMPLFLGTVVAQDAADPRFNAIDPAALAPAPTFGDSGPASRSSTQTEKTGELPATPSSEAQTSETPSSEAQTADWQPRLRIQLFRAPVAGAASPAGASQAQEEILLLSDSVNIDAGKSDDGQLAYALSCEGRMLLNVNGVRISGRDCSLADGTMTIRNAEVIAQENLVLHSDRLTLKISLAGVSVKRAAVDTVNSPCAADEKLTPVPDPIGESEARSEVPEKAGVDHSAPDVSAPVPVPPPK